MAGSSWGGGEGIDNPDLISVTTHFFPRAVSFPMDVLLEGRMGVKGAFLAKVEIAGQLNRCLSSLAAYDARSRKNAG